MRPSAFLLMCALGAAAAASVAACSSDEADGGGAGIRDGGTASDATVTDVAKSDQDSGAPLDPALFDDCVPSDGDPVFTWQNPDPAKVDVTLLKKIVKDAKTATSDSMIVAIGDTIVAHKCFAPAATKASTIQSVTKTVMSLAVGALVAEGKLGSLDAPVSTWFPEWTDGDRASVTLRMLLTQTSGIEDEVADGGTLPLFTEDDALAYARTVKPVATPGTTFIYSNTSIMLLGGIATQAAGEDVAKHVQAKIFAPLGITGATWSHDKAGNAYTPGGLFMRPLDLLRLARLARENGTWQGTEVVPASWIALTTKPEEVVDFGCYGYLWWMVRDNCAADTGLVGAAGPVEGFYADGFGGNYAAVIPSSGVIGARMKVQLSTNRDDVVAGNFDDFVHDLAKLGK